MNIIFKVGLFAGFLDITAACVNFLLRTNKNPVIVLQFVASGILGKTAFAGGIPVATLGLLLHFFIALIFAGLYFFLYPRLLLLRKNPFWSGVGYGLLVWIVMNGFVLPLSLVSRRPYALLPDLIEMMIMVGAIGLPISLLVHRHYQRMYQKSGAE
jgi:uncharacterized membrane protein YagU involved in acid resistance